MSDIVHVEIFECSIARYFGSKLMDRIHELDLELRQTYGVVNIDISSPMFVFEEYICQKIIVTKVEYDE